MVEVGALALHIVVCPGKQGDRCASLVTPMRAPRHTPLARLAIALGFPVLAWMLHDLPTRREK
jgi:hypothetical protein